MTGHCAGQSSPWSRRSQTERPHGFPRRAASGGSTEDAQSKEFLPIHGVEVVGQAVASLVSPPDIPMSTAVLSPGPKPGLFVAGSVVTATDGRWQGVPYESDAVASHLAMRLEPSL